MATTEMSKIGKRGVLVLPAQLRKRFGLQEGSYVIAEEREDGILIRPAVVLPYEPYTPERVALLQEADAIVREELRLAGLEREIWQSFAVLADIRSVGVMGDERTYGHPIIIRAVTSDDAMTADWARIPYDVLETMSQRIINEVPGINRVAYDITSKPPGTIEWE